MTERWSYIVALPLIDYYNEEMSFNFAPPPDFDREEFERRMRDLTWNVLPMNLCRLVRVQKVNMPPTFEEFISQMAMDGLVEDQSEDGGGLTRLYNI